MSATHHPAAPANLSPARRVVALSFFVLGAGFGSFAPHIPTIKDLHGLDEAELGLILFCLAGGAVLAMKTVGKLVDAHGSRIVVLLSTIGYLAALNGPLLMPDVVTLCISLALVGVMAGALDVSANVHAVGVEALHGRPLLSRMHGFYSVGAFAGAAFSSLMLSLEATPSQIVLIASAALVLVAVLQWRDLLPASADRVSADNSVPAAGRRNWFLIVLGLLGAVAMMAEGAMFDWSAIYMRDLVEAPADRVGWPFAAFSITMALGRFAGDYLAHKWGPTLLLRICTFTSVAGIAVMIAFPEAWPVILGGALLGFGLANCVPLVFSAGARVSGVSKGAGLATVAGFAYMGFVAGPPLVGIVAGFSSLPVAFAVLAVMLLPMLLVRLPKGGEK